MDHRVVASEDKGGMYHEQGIFVHSDEPASQGARSDAGRACARKWVDDQANALTSVGTAQQLHNALQCWDMQLL